MSTAKLTNVLQILSGGEPSQSGLQLANEALLLTLARATRSDTNIKPVEVDTVRALIEKLTGERVTEADVRVAAHSDIFETTSLTQCLARLSGKLSPRDRAMILGSLAEVIRSDLRVAHFEVAFYNEVADALRVAPNEVAQLIPG